MSRVLLTVILSVVASIQAINRPVYKIVLTQKGYAQFLQYDVETPPLREFTFCTWIRVFDLGTDQSIFTYVVNGNNRVVRLWLDSGGRYMKVMINGKVTSDLRVDIVKDVWRHVCLSYQSDFGAWALYVDSRLISCESTQMLYGFVLPSGGSVIIGYGTADNGAPNGFEGEIFGANMILSSTIERNYTLKVDPLYKQKHFTRNKLKKDTKDMNYIILSDLLTDEIQNNFEKTYLESSPQLNTSKSYIRFRTPHASINHSVGQVKPTQNTHTKDTSLEHEIFDFTLSDFRSSHQTVKDLWRTIDQPKFSVTKSSKQELSNAHTHDVPTVSEYETPPPPPASVYFDKTFGLSSPITESNYKLKDSTLKSDNIIYRKKSLSEVETPPPVQQHSSKVYGQWTSSKFAGTVLNYLKSINFNKREQLLRKVPQTIPLYKSSDTHPYASDFKLKMIRPPSQFKRKNLVEKRYDVIKRTPQINVKILEEDLRSTILKTHAETRPKKVELTNRGKDKTKKGNGHRFYRDAHYDEESDERSDSLEEIYHPKGFTLYESNKNKNGYFSQQLKKPRLSALPFLNLGLDSQTPESQTVANSKDVYFKSLSNANKWHNVKSYSNDYTPRKINMDSVETDNDRKKEYPAVRLKYIHKTNENLPKTDPIIMKGRKLALEVSNQSYLNHDSISVLKYNHGYLPTHDDKIKNDEHANLVRRRVKSKRHKNSFNKHVKIGNALNERSLLGENDEQKKKSFIGGNENVPDINRYRSDIDNNNEKVPPSLGPRFCKSTELYDKVLYVQQDESIGMTDIVSPVKEKNDAIEFVLQNYKKCSLTDSVFRRNTMLFIDWSKTPVRLFGGAYPKTTTDLCGFF